MTLSLDQERSLPSSTIRSRASMSVGTAKDGPNTTAPSSRRDSRDSDAPRSPPPRRRACRPKVRTGCITCKSRHVKCTEEKPACKQCTKLNLKCGGYPPPKVKKATARAERKDRTILPRPTEEDVAPARAHTSYHDTQQELSAQPAPQPSLSTIMPTIVPFANDNDTWYFALFRDQVIPELSPYHGTRFWYHMLHRDSTVHQCIRHSILSIGAYARAILELRQEKPWEQHASHPWRSPSPYCPHLRASLEHNTRALHSLRSHFRVHGVDNRLTMAATLLFIVFQNMQGNFHQSGDLIRKGIKIVKKMHPRSRLLLPGLRRYRWQRIRQGQEYDESEMATMFARHSISYVFVPFHHAKFAYHLLITDDTDDEETDSDSDGEQTRRSSISAEHDVFADFVSEWPQTVPEAQARWDHLLPVLASFQSKTVWQNLNPSIETDHLATLEEQAGLLSELHNFQSALDTLAAASVHVDSYASLHHNCALELLQLQATMAAVFVSCCTDLTEMAYDGFLAEFETVLARASVLMHSAPQNKRPTKIGFTNDAGVLQLLAFIGTKCRVRRVRQTAIALLKNHEWREGHWDGVSLALGIEGLMRLEGQWFAASAPQDLVPSTASLAIPQMTVSNTTIHGLSPSPKPEVVSTTPMVPPPQCRHTWTNMFWDFEKRHLTLTYSRVMRDELGKFQTATWTMDESRAVNEWSYASTP